MTGKAIMVLGATSDAGKSTAVMAICRILSDMGYSVCPFKSQNMSLNAKATADGCEISMVQELQCIAARTEPTFRVNPILLKPTRGTMSQVVVEGKVFGTYGVDDYYSDFVLNHGFGILKRNLDSLLDEYEYVVMEGAGSPAEINIYDFDIANMRAAEAADADCILVVNMGWGGSYAYVLGTLMLMPECDRKRIKAVLYNNLRGSAEGAMEGARILEKIIGIPTLGVVPHIENGLPREDSEFFREVDEVGDGEKIIGVIRLPRIANFTDVDPLFCEDVTVRFVTKKDQIPDCDAIVIPGTKNSIADMRWLRESGIADEIISSVGRKPLLGICGGYQMLGRKLRDPKGLEDPSTPEIDGLGIFDMETQWDDPEKITIRNKGTMILTGEEVTGYQIHVGRSVSREDPLFDLQGEKEGSKSEEKMVFGTYLHGVLERPAFRNRFLSLIEPALVRNERPDYCEDLEANIVKVTEGFREAMDMGLFEELFMGAVPRH